MKGKSVLFKTKEMPESEWGIVEDSPLSVVDGIVRTVYLITNKKDGYIYEALPGEIQMVQAEETEEDIRRRNGY